MIISEKGSGSCNVLFPNICVPKKRKDINVEVAKHIPCDCKCKLNSAKLNSNKKWSNMSLDIFINAKKIIAVILAHVFV